MSLPIRLPLEPMLARAVSEVPRPRRPGEYTYEPKWDGYRCIAARDGATVTLWSRSGKQLTEYFPDVVAAVRAHLPEQVVVDGEIVVRSGPPAELVCFDLIALDDVDLTSLPHSVRRAALLQLLDGVAPGARLHASRATQDPDVARRWFDDFEGAGLDGVVAKLSDAPYTPGQRTMLKVKHARTAEAVVIGYGRSRSGPGVGSLHLGLYDEGRLVHVGGIGALPDAARVQLAGVLADLVLTGDEADAAPAPALVSRAGPRDFVPLRPELVVEVAFDQLEGKRFRHAVTYVRMRPDRVPESCLLDQIERAPAYDLDAVLGSGES